MSKFIIFTLAVVLVLETTGVIGWCWRPGNCGGYDQMLSYKIRRHWEETWEQKFDEMMEQTEFLFAVDPDVSPYAFYDDDLALVGFNIDLIKAVCEIAGKTCRWSALPPSGCSKTVNREFVPGDYLMGGEVDACIAWTDDTERQYSVDFTDPLYLTEALHFTRRAVGADGPAFTPNDAEAFVGRTVVLVNGWVTDEFCLRRVNYDLASTSFLIEATLEDAIEAVRNGIASEGRVLFFPRSFTEGLGAANRIVSSEAPAVLNCGFVNAVMVKRGSSLPIWWNDAFKTLVETGRYDELCAEAAQNYGRAVNCLTSAEP